MQAAFNVFAGVVIVPLVLAATSIWRGFVLSILWGWFLVPLGMPPLTVAYAIGVSLIVGFLTVRHSKEDEQPEYGKAMLRVTLVPAFALAFGWIVSRFT